METQLLAVKPIPAPPAQLPTADFVPPYITDVAVNSNALSITFNEEIQQDEGLIYANDRFKVQAGKKLFNISDYTISTEKELYFDPKKK